MAKPKQKTKMQKHNEGLKKTIKGKPKSPTGGTVKPGGMAPNSAG